MKEYNNSLYNRTFSVEWYSQNGEVNGDTGLDFEKYPDEFTDNLFSTGELNPFFYTQFKNHHPEVFEEVWKRSIGDSPDGFYTPDKRTKVTVYELTFGGYIVEISGYENGKDTIIKSQFEPELDEVQSICEEDITHRN